MIIGIVGLGLIGGSLAQASKNAGHEVYGYDENTETLNNAINKGAIGKSLSIDQLANQCDIVVLCVPSRTAVSLVEQALSGTALVTDVSSVKQPICTKVSSLDPMLTDRFIGGHPMAGSEQSGFDASRADMFTSKMWILVPPKESSLANVAPIESFVTSIGAEHCVLSPEQHDQLVAHISHLPQLASSALMDLAATESVDNEIILRLAGGGFRDMTRIAANNVTMWLDIVHDNANEITNALDSYISNLQDIKRFIETNDASEIEKLFTRARSARSSLPDVARRFEHLTEILIPVPDTPGVLAKITAITKEINVYDIKIVHALEDDRGVLSLVVKPEDSSDLIETINNNGFEVISGNID